MIPYKEWQLRTRRLGRRVLVFDRLDSTNTLAASLADDPANDGVAVLADEQTAGRGQPGRSWHCPPRSGVLLSLLLFPPATLLRPVVLTAWAAVAVCETVRQATGLQAKIKWPNDVLIRGRKVCGILMERVARGAERGTSEGVPHSALRAPHCVVGIGLNANQPAEVFTQAGLTEAVSLAIVTGKRFDSHLLARQLLEQLDEEYDRLCAGDLATLEALWKWRIGLLGKQVRVECHDGNHVGRLHELGFDGMMLEGASGKPIQLRPERVRHLRPA